jgi:HlyD family secretion protein
MPRMPGQRTRRAGTQAGAERTLWVLQDGTPQAVVVRTGATDGRMTEVTSDKLQPGMRVITEQTAGNAK